MNPLQSLLIQNAPFSVEEASTLLHTPRNKTSMILARYEKQGHLKRVKRGLYMPISERFLTPEQSLSDPWKVMPSLFPNGYIGGWSAANFWQLTEQIFENTAVLTTDPVKHGNCKKLGFNYRVFSTHGVFGKDTVWRDTVSVPISDPHRTLLDMINNPLCGGGIQHTLDCVRVYIDEQMDETLLMEYAQKYTKGSFYKRLGFIVEKMLGESHPLCLLAKEKLTTGYTKIDSTLSCPTLITRWNLFINDGLTL
jgi:predicted transcriptional regulator of viral defense system